MADQPDMGRTAPTYQIPLQHIISVEHPAIIRNVDKAIETLQGNGGISKILNPPRADTPANLFLRPADAMSRPLQSTSTPSSNILLKITVPKRTGRKRKRGSGEPFTMDSVPVVTAAAGGGDGGDVAPERPSAKEILRSLSDNVGKYQVEAVGRVDRTHVFRGMPDFVFSTIASPFTNRFREQILSFDYEKMKQFDLDMSKGSTSKVDLIPPPSFSHGDVPFSYIYRQNPTVKQSIDTTGKLTTINTSQAVKILTQTVDNDVATIPTKPSENCAPIETLDKPLQETIAALQALFEERPAWTRRGLRNSLKTAEQRTALRHAVPYVGYIFRSGPWRDAIVRFGHDPRSSPESRKYQTMMFKILPREPEVARDGGRRHTLPRTEAALASTSDPSSQEITPPNSHIFTGKPPLPQDGRIWMLCDISDPQLSTVLFPEQNQKEKEKPLLNQSCEIYTDGWYGAGTLAKIRTVMRAKIQCLIEGKVPTDSDYVRILALPDRPEPGDQNLGAFTLDPDVATSREMQLATEVRSTIKSSASWRAMAMAMAGSGSGRGEEGLLGQDVNEKRVQWPDRAAEGEIRGEESEGEEEERERAEMLEAQAAAATAAVAAREQVQIQVEDEEDEEDEDVRMDQDGS